MKAARVEGKSCGRGHTERYASSGLCVECGLERSRRHRARGKRPTAQGTPCPRGHTERYPSGSCITCKREQTARWRTENREASRAHTGKWRRANLERVRAENRQQKKAWRAANPGKARAADERSREYRARWQKDNRERLNAMNRARRAADPGKTREYQRRWRRANPEKVRAKAEARRAANPEKASAATRKWQKANPEKVRAIVAKRRARRLGAQIGCRKEYAAFVRWAKAEPVLPCFYCEHPTTPDARHLDHYVPLTRGGADAVENLRIACPTCNHRKRNKMPEDFTPTKRG